MSELKPCPFCGGEAGISVHDNHYVVECMNQWCEVGAYTELLYPQSAEQAIEAWNTRYERTCDWEWVHSGPFFDIFKCRKCLYEFYEPRCVHGYSDLVANYCPNCGAKVVSE